MSVVNKYRIWCETESDYVYIWAETEPTTCPTNSGHTIDTDKTVIETTVGDDSVSISEYQDESNRPYVRAESRDIHDNTYFTTRGDKWTTVMNEAVGTGDGSTTVFFLDYPETRGATIYIDGTPQASGVTVDISTYEDNNGCTHFGTGKVTFDVAPAVGEAITATYQWAEIGTASQIIYDATSDSSPKTINLEFCDPVHIKDGLVMWKNGASDSTANLYVMVPDGQYYYDKNGALKQASGDTSVDHYVIDFMMNGDCPMGTEFDVETRSAPIPKGMQIKIVVDEGSATDFYFCARLEINRERTVVDIVQA